MTEKLTPFRWAADLGTILKVAFQEERFPVKVKRLALDYTHQRFPDDPITDVMGGNLPRFEGGLFKADEGKKGWGIIYNDAIRSQGRINFTLARCSHSNITTISSRKMHRRRFECQEAYC